MEAVLSELTKVLKILQKEQPQNQQTTPNTIQPFDEQNETFDNFLARIQNFMNLKEWTDPQKCTRIFLNFIGPKYFQTICNLTAPDKPENKTYEELVGLLRTHVCPKPSQIAEQHKFCIRLQKEGESIANYNYHCQYNAIELIWAQVKGYAARHNTKPPFSVKKMEGLLKEACAQVTQEDWSKVVQKTKKIIMDCWKYVW